MCVVVSLLMCVCCGVSTDVCVVGSVLMCLCCGVSTDVCVAVSVLMCVCVVILAGPVGVGTQRAGGPGASSGPVWSGSGLSHLNSG